METNFHIDHVRKICVIEYLNLRTESQMCGKLRDFWEKKKKKTVVIYINIVVLDRCCCAKNIVTCL